MDGHGEHIKARAVNAMCHANVASILRPPHTSHLTQPEDLINFGTLLPLFRERKHSQLASNAMWFGETKLVISDFEDCIREPFYAAFCPAKNQSAWAHAGYYPFTMRPYWLLRAEEERKAKAEGTAGLKVNLIPKMIRKRTQAEVNSRVDEAQDAAAAPTRSTKKTARTTAADVWDRGPITAGEGKQILINKDAAVEAKLAKKLEGQRVRERESGQRSVAYAAVATAA